MDLKSEGFLKLWKVEFWRVCKGDPNDDYS